MPDVRERPEVRLKLHDYQPTRAEFEADARVDATFEEAVAVLAMPVRIRQEPARKRRARQQAQ